MRDYFSSVVLSGNWFLGTMHSTIEEFVMFQSFRVVGHPSKAPSTNKN